MHRVNQPMPRQTMSRLRFFVIGTAGLLLASGGEHPNGTTIESRIMSVVRSENPSEDSLDLKVVDQLHAAYRVTEDDPEQQRRMASLALGVHYIPSDHELALQYLSTAEMLTPLVDPLLPVVKYYQARAWFRSGTFAKAAEGTRALLKRNLGSDWDKALFHLAIESLFGAKDYQGVTALYNEYAKRVSVSRRDDDLMQLAAQAFQALKMPKEQAEVLEDLASNYPTTPLSRWAFAELQELKCAGVGYNHSLYFLMALASNATLDVGIREYVIAAMEEPLRMGADKTRRMTIDERLDALFKAKFYEEAQVLTEEQLLMEENRRNSKRLAELTVLLGRIHFRLTEFDKAARYFSLFLKDNPTHHQRHSVTEYLADTYKRLDAYEASAMRYAEVAKATSSREMRWAHFWNLYRAKNYQAALNILSLPGYLEGRGGTDGEEVLYWQARVLEKLGRDQDAYPILYSLMKDFGESFYADLIASNHPDLIGQSPNASAPKPTPAVAPQADEGKEGEVKTGSRGNRFLNFSLAAQLLKQGGAEARAILSPELKIINDLIRVGLKPSASRQLDAINWANYNDEKSFAAIGEIAMSLDNYRPSGRLKQRNFSALYATPKSWWEINAHQTNYRAEWQIYFPEAYRNLVDDVADRAGVDKFYVLSIMRAESFYNKDARSVVGARGLMQIMPYTGVRLAKLIGDTEFAVTDLSDPKVNVAYGAYYLRKLMDYYGDNIVLATAAYNAGPEAVSRWLEYCNDCEMDEFVESIPYKETRRYVKKVLLNLANYRRIYLSEQTLPKLPNLPKTLDYDMEIF